MSKTKQQNRGRGETRKRNRPPERIHALLKSIYTDLKHPASFSSPYKLYRAARKVNDGIRLRQVEDWLETQDTYTKYRDVKTRFFRRKVLTRGIGYQHQADLVDYSAIARDNAGVKFILTIIDCFSRFALAIPIKSKSGVHVAEALKKAWNTMRVPKKLQTDQGREFYNKDVQELLVRNKVVHFSTYQDLKAQIVERFNRDLRENLKKSMAERKSLNYLSVLPDYLYGYNHRPHGTLYPYAPADVNKNNEKEVFELQYGEYLRTKKRRHKYRVGDKVRIAAFRHVFRKSYKHKTFTDEVFEIIDCLDTHPPMYRLRDTDKGELIEGTFYETELQRVRSS